MPLVADISSLSFLEQQTLVVYHWLPILLNLTTLDEREACGAMPLFFFMSVHLCFLCHIPLVLCPWLLIWVHCCFLSERPFVLRHWLLMSVHCRCLSDVPLVCHWLPVLLNFTFLSANLWWYAIGCQCCLT